MTSLMLDAPEMVEPGIDAEAMAEVETLFRAQLSPLRLYPGAALAVYHGGRLVLDLWGGHADTRRGEPVGQESLFYLFSGTKPLASVALWQQIERGRVGLDDRVAEVWPAFAANGKERVTVRHVLSHRGGLPLTPPELTPERYDDWVFATKTIAAMRPLYEPGTVSAYHQLTQQWVCAELVQRLDGRPYRDYLQDELFRPLLMTATYLGLPLELEDRLVKLHATDGMDNWSRGVFRLVTGHPLHREVVPAASGVSAPRDMARFYAALAAGGSIDGARILRPETVDRMLAVEVDGETDATFDVPVRRALGFELGGLPDVRRLWAGSRATASTFWHGGFGTSICWGDRATGLAMASFTNGVRRDEAGAAARRDLSDAVRAIVRD